MSHTCMHISVCICVPVCVYVYMCVLSIACAWMYDTCQHFPKNHLQERLLDQAQAQALYTPPFWGPFA